MRRALRTLIVGAVAVGVWYSVAPPVVGHFGIATSWPSTVPNVLKFDARDYDNPTRCLPRARTPFGPHQPYRVGSMHVLVGDDFPILVPHRWRPSDPAPVILTVRRSGDCYTVYSLEGGP